MENQKNRTEYGEIEGVLVGYLQLERCLNFRELLERYVKGREVSLDSVSGEVSSALDRLEAGKRVIALFPRGVNQRGVVESIQRYYVLTEQTPVERTLGERAI